MLCPWCQLLAFLFWLLFRFCCFVFVNYFVSALSTESKHLELVLENVVSTLNCFNARLNHLPPGAILAHGFADLV